MKTIYESLIRKFIENILIYDIPGKILLEELKKRLRIDTQSILNIANMLREIIHIENEDIVVTVSKVDIIEYCLKRGVYIDLEKISRYISWQDFEELIKRFFREFEYYCIHKVRISIKNRKVEIDLIACKDNVLLLVDCKRYVKSRIRKEIVEEHVRKVEDIARYGAEELFLKLPIRSRYFEYYLYPVVISVHDIYHNFVDIPIVSIYRLRDFLYNFYYNRYSYKCFVVYRF